jgi:DNA-binding transcriptional ArsR family regulator
MPDIPIRLTLSTEQQFKAISDMARSRILGVIQYQPLTARQIARRLRATPGAIGHHLRVLEEAGLVRIVARRITRGIVASYYTRTARIFDYDLPSDVKGLTMQLDVAEKARAELMDATISYENDPVYYSAFPHVRLSSARLMEYQQRFRALVDELIEEAPDPDGEVCGVFLGIFQSPPYMQMPGKGDGAMAPGEGDAF